MLQSDAYISCQQSLAIISDERSNAPPKGREKEDWMLTGSRVVESEQDQLISFCPLVQLLCSVIFKNPDVSFEMIYEQIFTLDCRLLRNETFS